MRRGNDFGWLKDEAGRMVGLNLGADFTSEHEWGVKKTQQAFGLIHTETNFGIARRTVTVLPGQTRSIFKDAVLEPQFAFEKFGTKKDPEAALVFSYNGALRHINGLKRVKGAWVDTELRLQSVKDENRMRASHPEWTYGMQTAWDDGSFGVHVRGKENVALLEEVWTAFQAKDAAIWLGGGGVFQRAGLVLGILSRLPAAGLENLRAGDEDYYKLGLAKKATGIEEILTAAGKRWYALTPGWKLKSTRLGEVQTEHPVMFFLNPCEQQKYDSGWFTVEQLKEWAKDEGPVVKKKPTSAL